jgi:hypothetical protein
LQAPIAIRVNPDVAAGGHPNISTGKKGDKFGVPWTEAEDLYAEAATLPGIKVVGVDVHIGSQIGDLVPMRAAFEKVVGLSPAPARGRARHCPDRCRRRPRHSLQAGRRAAPAIGLCRHDRGGQRRVSAYRSSWSPAGSSRAMRASC